MLFFWGLGTIPFYSKGEPREGLVVWEIYQTGNWVLPLRNIDQIPSKPPMFHWLGTWASEIAGHVNEFTIRFPSALLGTLGVLLTYLVGAWLWGPVAGLVAGLVLATNVEWWRAATTARVDMTLAFFMLCSFLFFDATYRRGEGGIKAAVFLGVLLAFSILAKGPLGVIVPCAVFFVYLLLERNLGFLRKLNPLVVVGIAILIAGTWYGLALWQQGERFFLKQIMQENLTAAAGTRGHAHPVYYFIPMLFGYLAPWSLFLPALAVSLYSRRHSLARSHQLFPLIWFATVFILFSLAPAKRSVYILPLYPAVALLFGAWWQTLNEDPPLARKLFQIGVYLNVAVFFISAVLWLAQVSGVDLMGIARSLMSRKARSQFPIYAELVARNRGAILLWALLSLGGSLGLVVAMKKRAWETLAITLAGLMGAGLFLVQNGFHPDFAALHSFKPFMVRVKTTVTDQSPLYFYKESDYGTLFYARRHIPLYGASADATGTPFFLLMWERDWKQIPAREGLQVLEISQVTDSDLKSRLVLLKVTDEAPLRQKRVKFPETETPTRGSRTAGRFRAGGVGKGTGL